MYIFAHKNRFLFFIILKLADVTVYKNRFYIKIVSYTLKMYFFTKSNIIIEPTKNKLRNNVSFLLK